MVWNSKLQGFKNLLIYKNSRTKISSDSRSDAELAHASYANVQWFLWTKMYYWVHRRVQTTDFVSDGRTIVHHSLDFQIPDYVIADLPNENSQIPVPVTLLQKGELTSFDCRDSSGKSIPVATTQQHYILVMDMVDNIINSVHNLSPDQAQFILENLDKALQCQPGKEGVSVSDNAPDNQENSEEVSYVLQTKNMSAMHIEAEKIREKLRIFEADYTRVAQDEASEGAIAYLCNFIDSMIDSFILFVYVDRKSLLCNQRQVIKFSWEERIPDREKSFAQGHVSYKVQALGFSNSYHVEIRVPGSCAIRDVVVDDAYRIPNDKSTPPTVCHFRLPTGESALPSEANEILENDSLAEESVPPRNFTSIKFHVIPAESGLKFIANASVIILVFFAVASMAQRFFGVELIVGDREKWAPGIGALLVGPAVILSWINREPEHELTALVNKTYRDSIWIVAATLLIIAGLLALPVSLTVWRIGWACVYFLAAGAAAMLWVKSANLRS